MSDFFQAFHRIAGTACNYGILTPIEWNSRKNGEEIDESIEDVHYRYGSEGLDEYAERLTFTINTAQDRVREDTPFYLIHGWDPRSTLEATLPLGSTKRRDQDPRRWRYHMQRHYQRAREAVYDRLRIAIQDRADRHSTEDGSQEIEVGSQVWLYLNRVKEGYARKLAHMWHGPFRVREFCERHVVRLEMSNAPYRLFPLIHISKLERVKTFPNRLKNLFNVEEADRLNFDESLLPEDSWERTLDEDEFKVEKIMDVRSGRRTHFGRVQRQYLVLWKGSVDPTWIDEVDLKCGALLKEFDCDRVSKNGFEVMQSHEAAVYE